jgi:hypothetical protein
MATFCCLRNTNLDLKDDCEFPSEMTTFCCLNDYEFDLCMTAVESFFHNDFYSDGFRCGTHHDFYSYI